MYGWFLHLWNHVSELCYKFLILPNYFFFVGSIPECTVRHVTGTVIGVTVRDVRGAGVGRRRMMNLIKMSSDTV